MPHRVIASEQDLIDTFKLLRNLDLPLTLQWSKGRGRSLDQNALQFKWATEAAQQRGDMTPVEVQREWKLRYGVPILRANNEQFRAHYDKNMKGWTYADKLAAMEWLPVSSILTVPQMTEYLETIQRECTEQGIRLTDPEAA